MTEKARIQVAVCLERWFESYGKLGEARPNGAPPGERAEWLCRRIDTWRGLQNLSRWLAAWIEVNVTRLVPTPLVELSGGADLIGADVPDSTLRAAWTICRRLTAIVGSSDKAVQDAWQAACCEPEAVPPEASDKSRGGRPKKGEPSAEARMIDMVISRPESKGWTARQFAIATGLSATSVKGTMTWDQLAEIRLTARAERQIAKARRRR